MKIACNRCQKLIDRPDERNAYYITEFILDKDKIFTRRHIIICRKCKKENDTIIW